MGGKYMESGWQVFHGGRRQDSEELLKGPERLSHAVFKVEGLQINEVRHHRGIVVGEEPGPRCHALVVVVQDPLKSRNVVSFHPHHF